MHACFIAVNFSIHTGGEGVRKVSTFNEEAQKVCLQPFTNHTPINNDHSLNLFIYDTYDNTIKTCFIVLKQVELSAGLKWAVMTLICPC